MYTGTRPGVSPAIRAGKGWRGRRELAPRCSATRISCISLAHIDRDMCHTRSPYHLHHTSHITHHASRTTHHAAQVGTGLPGFRLGSFRSVGSVQVHFVHSVLHKRTCLHITVPFCLFLRSLVLPSELDSAKFGYSELRDGVHFLGGRCEL